LESELFGYEKGAFTGALEAKKGLLEECNGGTVLLDEIGYISLRMQAVLLRVLQDQQIRRLGGTTNIQCDIRFIVLSNINLKEAIDRGDFREDLYHRLNVFPLEMPPLRKRGNDSIELTYHFCKKHQTSLGKKITFIDTPGHAAFSTVRSTGACIADIAILIVSAEDGVKPQTIEAYKSIQEAKIPFVVAINKIDKTNANVEKS